MIRIKLLREEFGFTQQELANKLNKAKSTIAMYENETRKPSLKVLNQLSEIFNVSTDYLLGKTDTKIETKENETDDTFTAIYEDYKELAQEDKEVINATIKALKKKNKK